MKMSIADQALGWQGPWVPLEAQSGFHLGMQKTPNQTRPNQKANPSLIDVNALVILFGICK